MPMLASVDELMPEALVGFADRLVDALDQIDDVGRFSIAGLDDGEFVAAEPGDEIRAR